MAYYVDDKGTLRTSSGSEVINYSKDKYNMALRERDREENSDYKKSSSGSGISDYAHNKNFYYVDDRNVSDYAPYGRNQNGTPYRSDGSIIGFGGNGEKYKEIYGQEGYDSTGKSDLRNYKDTLKVGDYSKKGWNSHSVIDDGREEKKDTERFNWNYSSQWDKLYEEDVNPYQDMLRGMEKARKEKLEYGKKVLEQQALKSAREAYLQHMKASNAIVEKMAGSGISGGALETTVANLNSAYGNAVNDIESEKQKGIEKLQSQYNEGVSSDTYKIEEKIAAQKQKLLAEQRAYERLLEQRRYNENK